MKVDIYSVKAKCQAGDMSQNIKPQHKKAKAKRLSAREGSSQSQLGNLHNLLEIQQRALGLQERTVGVMYDFMRIQPKRFCIFPLKVAATILSGSWKGTVGA